MGERLRLSQALAVPFVVLLIDNAFELDGLLYGPFLASVIGTLTMGLWSHVIERVQLTGLKYVAASLIGVCSCLAVAVLPWWIQQERFVSALFGILVVSVAVAIVNAILRSPHEQPREDDGFHQWRLRNYVMLCAAAYAIFACQSTVWMQRWYPGDESLILR